VFPILENLYLENLTTGIDIDSSVDIIYFTTISNCDIESCTTGINFDATCANWQVMRGRIKNCTTGISANSPNGLVERVDIEQNTAGIHVNERNIVLFKCHLENNTAHVTYGVNHSQFTAQWNEVALPYTLEEPGDGRYQFKENWRTDTTPALPVSRRTMYQDRDSNVYMLEAVWNTAREFRLYNVTDSAEIWRFNSGGDMFVVLGDMETETAGKGLVVKTPDGTKRYRIAVDNAGAVTSTLLT
jgi:hypothetical protein